MGPRNPALESVVLELCLGVRTLEVGFNLRARVTEVLEVLKAVHLRGLRLRFRA